MKFKVPNENSAPFRDLEGTKNSYVIFRVAYQVDTNHFPGIGIIPPLLGWYCWYSSVGIAVLSMVGISVGITVFV